MKPVVPECLEVGQIVTVMSWINIRDRSYVGDIMRVMAVDLPFIVVNCKNGFTGKRRLQLDTREVALGYPSEPHVKLIRPSVASASGKICA